MSMGKGIVSEQKPTPVGKPRDRLTETRQLYRWDTIPWQHVQRSVFKLQKRIYQASRRGADDKRRVVEEPDEGKSSRPVLKPSQEGQPSWLRQRRQLETVLVVAN
jgi:hypothetical protein